MQLRSFESGLERKNVFVLKIEDLVRESIIQGGLSFYRIESYICNQQVAPQDVRYMPVIRIVTYFDEAIGRISEVLGNEFVLSVDKDTDKRKNNEQFSNKSTTYTAALKPNRQALAEYKREGGTKFKIQLCSLLQDALSGIENELGYDAEISEETRRDLYRVSTLLEMADNELLKIKNKLPARAGRNDVSEPGQNGTAHINQQTEEISGDIVSPAPVPPPAAPDAEIESAEPVAETVVAPHNDSPTIADPKADTSIAAESNSGATHDTISQAGPNYDGTRRRHILSNMDKVVIVNVNANGMVEKTTEKNAEPEPQSSEPQSEPVAEQPVFAAPQEPQPAQQSAADDNDQITESSLKDYVIKSTLLREIDTQIAERAGARINTDADIEGDVERLRFLKVHTLKQLHDRLDENKAEIVAFAEKWIGKDNGGSFDSGIGLFYLEYLLVGKKNDPAFAVEYVVKFISDNDYSARYIIPTYNSIRSAETAGYSHLTLKA